MNGETLLENEKNFLNAKVINVCTCESVLDELNKIHKNNFNINLQMNLSLGNIVNPFDSLTRQDIYCRSIDNRIEDTILGFLYTASKIDNICLWIDSVNPDDVCLKQFIVVKFPNHKIKICDMMFLRNMEPKYFNFRIDSLDCHQLQELESYEYYIDESERFEYKKNWNELIVENKSLRIIDNNKIISVNLDYYDKEIINCLHSRKLSMMHSVAYLMSFFPQLSELFLKYRVEFLVDKHLVTIKL